LLLLKVTRLGGFSPLGRLFTLGIFLNEVAEIIGYLFHSSKSYALNLILKNGLGQHYIRALFTNSSGHPVVAVVQLNPRSLTCFPSRN
jgi:hypothetical protein